METSLHQQLKRCYAGTEANTEVTMGKYRIDAVRDDELIEVQCASLSAIRDKSQKLLKRHKLRVVKPVISRTRIIKVNSKAGPVVSRRMSPKRGCVMELFEELIYFTRVFPHPNLTLEVPMVCVEQTRMPRKGRRRRRQPNYKVVDTSLDSISETFEFREPADLLALIPWKRRPESFDTADIARAIDRPRWVAQQIAYVLRHTGAINEVSRRRSGIVYEPIAA
ncbi:hypothetical protein [Planctomycetes bacterium K23_9]|uniref:DUF8091 domain-containing protein n=1 Tax=Stieleria marina TaxID=1930275 RepID=A0A517NW58_9BACT|nr:hypothetical protein K239x_33540 [Planctomycetes bacterium K23_9]